MAGAGVEVESLVVRFGSVTAVDDVTLTASPGRAVALLGRNGAGKSTTLRVAAAVLAPTTGRVTVAGVDVVADPLAVKHLVGYCPDVGGLVPRGTPWEHLELSARLRGLHGWDAGPPAQQLHRAQIPRRQPAALQQRLQRRGCAREEIPRQPLELLPAHQVWDAGLDKSSSMCGGITN